MAEKQLKIVGDGNGNNGYDSSVSLSDLLEEIERVAGLEKVQEADLQRLRLSNVKHLANIKKQDELNLIKKLAELQEAATEKINKQKLDALESEYNNRMALAKEVNDEEFKRRVGKTKEEYKADWKLRKQAIEKENELRLKYAKKQAENEAKELARKRITGGNSKIDKAADVWKSIRTVAEYDEDGNKIGERAASVKDTLKGVTTELISGLSSLAKNVDQTIDRIAGYKSAVDTRLQGLNRNTGGLFGGSSYWDNISRNITGMAGISPLIKQSALADRVSSMVSQGIAFNVEQRAVLQELSGKIATTFNAANGTLLRLVRIQQQDTTAGRLGMESALTAFLNNMYATTEYMQGIADSVKGSLEDAMSLMTGENALSFEYQVQKWLGSMYSVGMSQSAVSGLGSVLGKLASGQLEGITGGGQGTLMVMAANQAGLSITDILNGGLDADSTNALMNAMVDYLAKIYQAAGDSKVIQQQMAQVYGMNAADLKAAVNLARSTGVIAKDGLTYSAAMQRLNEMANTMGQRTSIGEYMSNAFDNIKYSMAAGIANNPALYGIYKTAGLLDTLAGGINIPAMMVAGTGVDLNATVADLMRAGAMGGGILSSMAAMISAGGGGGVSGSGILRAAGIGDKTSFVTRGTGAGLATSGGMSVSESGSFIGNASGSDVQSKTMSDANDAAKAELASATEQEMQMKDLHNDIISIYQLLARFANDGAALNVTVTNTTPIRIEQTGGILY